MSKPSPLQYNTYYHIYNRGINRGNIFIEERNYTHFLTLCEKHIEPVAEIFAYCLMRNHFHMLVKIKTEQETRKVFSENPYVIKLRRMANRLESQAEKPFGSEIKTVQYPSKKFSDFFNAYAKTINAAYGHSGSVFQHPFGRVMITRDMPFFRVIAFIHQNPQKHGFVDDFRDWKYSSYGAIISNKPTHLKRETVLEWFGNERLFHSQHARWVTRTQSQYFSGEDLD